MTCYTTRTFETCNINDVINKFYSGLIFLSSQGSIKEPLTSWYHHQQKLQIAGTWFAMHHLCRVLPSTHYNQVQSPFPVMFPHTLLMSETHTLNLISWYQSFEENRSLFAVTNCTRIQQLKFFITFISTSIT